ncbi:hypothetical protein K438DRAFT_1835610 [Mycena galopus ATCC 62051]|nr:hypothetical protein K438DRAFT_1835610 [Mycena galopus ATCC 62051]
MLRSMSTFLMCSKKLLLDTAFKHLNGKGQEFEMETWELDQMKSLVRNRAFTMSQSAQAHLILSTRIFEIACADTGILCHFRHIHGDRFELWITDAHKGQVLGAGIFCQKLSAEFSDVYCPMDPTKLLRSLDPYKHLHHLLHLCTVHYKCNINTPKPYTSQKTRNAMLSLSSSQVHPDLEGTFRIIHCVPTPLIEKGGRKAKAWLKDKQTGSRFTFPAIYQSASLIPLEIWKAALSTSNRNEQAHRNINCDGVNLTMLSGIMRGMQYDARVVDTLQLYSSQGIYVRDQMATHFRRLQRSLNRHIIVQTHLATAAATLANEDTPANILVAPPVAMRIAYSHLAGCEEGSTIGPLCPINNKHPGPLFTTTPLAGLQAPAHDAICSTRGCLYYQMNNQRITYIFPASRISLLMFLTKPC